MKKELKGFVVGVVLASLVVSAIPTMAERVSKSAELVYNNIKVVIDGKQADLKDAQGNTVEPFIVEGTTYLPVRAVANALNKAVSWDGATQTVYLGKNEEIEQPSVWLKDLETFTGNVNAKSADEIEFGGSDYNYYLTDNTGNVYKSYMNTQSENVSYLLDYKYSKFGGMFYLSKNDKSTEYGYRLLVYGDGKVIYHSKMITAGSKPIDFNVNVSNVSTMKIEIQQTNSPLKYYSEDEEYNWRTQNYTNVFIGNAGLYE
ncbi:MAG: NPCBM/NEW2 domain-containing protein [Clostridia bacterium]|nr:NPCBM/NEW2 domain-containing protein [Clostridia bacterium]